MTKVIKTKTYLILAGLLFLLPSLLPAQTAAELETVMRASVVTCAQAVKFVSSSAGSDASATEITFEQALENGWFPKGTTSDEGITLGKLSLLIMKAFKLKGGLMYTLAPGQRYAYRTMVSREFIQGAADPAMTVTGERFLLILGKVVNDGEEEK